MPSLIKIPVQEYHRMSGPFHSPAEPVKHRFYCKVQDVPSSLLDWMQPNPREQNLTSTVAKAIDGSLREDNQRFHLRNRGIFLSAADVIYSECAGTVAIVLDNPALHGDIDGGHTLRLIINAQDVLSFDQYVEFEVLTGLSSVADIAEARNTSVALDRRSLEELKDSFAVLKESLSDVEVCGNRFFDRVELKMNQQQGDSDRIDVRALISILLMFNLELYPHTDKVAGADVHPIAMYGGKETSLKKYLSLGGGETEKRNEALRQMSPIFVDICKLWDTIEREMALVDERKYAGYRFASSVKAPKAMFSQASLPYNVPQAIIFPVVAAFRALVTVQEGQVYKWACDPFVTWNAAKKGLVQTILAELKAFKGNPNTIVKNKTLWNNLFLSVRIELLRFQHGESI